ncbi:MAG: MvaI/BcnI family restriction endonuclease [Candidatus Diapherotrites archaeon]|nr:MvaI/BcnI family restriction endonuclease [Candidatus Diapherotrites archaeon]
MLSFDAFLKKLEKIKKRGYIETHRLSDTGVGKTLEDELGMKENNVAGPDHIEFELKSARINSSSMVTLFTKSPLPRGINLCIRNTYGYPSKEAGGDLELHVTLENNRFIKLRNGKKLKVKGKKDRLNIVNGEGEIVCYWLKSDLQKAFETKFKNALLLVKAESRFNKSKKEEFLYKEAYALQGFDFKGFISALYHGVVKIDIRLGHYESGRLKGKRHDHGTAFRAMEKNLDILYVKKKKVL